jgi:ABC-type transport system substrate-binding protein
MAPESFNLHDGASKTLGTTNNHAAALAGVSAGRSDRPTTDREAGDEARSKPSRRRGRAADRDIYRYDRTGAKAGRHVARARHRFAAELSMHEEVDAQPARMTMPMFNNLVMFDQHVKQNSTASIVPDLASGWSWNEDGTALTFPLRQGVKWHDGKPFTAADVRCTWDLLTGKAAGKLRLDPRKSWYRNLAEVTTNRP